MMARTDINCFYGHWPFRRIRDNSFDNLKKRHAENGISSGYISSLNSIFYNDPFEGDEELHDIIKGSNYRHILTVNPTLPGFAGDIQNGKKFFDIKGVRIYPGYHGYDLESLMLDRLCEILTDCKLPLYLTLRMEDERLNHIIYPTAISTDSVSRFIEKHKNNNIILTNARYSELTSLRDTINANSNVFFDTSGLKEPLFPVERLIQIFNVEKIIYGSMYPLYCMKSSIFMVDKADISESEKEKIFYGNSKRIFE